MGDREHKTHAARCQQQKSQPKLGGLGSLTLRHRVTRALSFPIGGRKSGEVDITRHDTPIVEDIEDGCQSF